MMENNSCLLLLLLLLSIYMMVALQMAAAARLATTKLSGIYAFGDAVLDSGNNNQLVTICRADHQPYGMDFPNREPTGRFSNGKLPGDILVSDLGIKDLLPAYLDKNRNDEELLTGVSFASACSGFDDLTANEVNVLTLTTQFENFQKAFQTMQAKFGTEKAVAAVENALFLLSAGSNDMMDNYYPIIERRVYTLEEYHEKLLTSLDHFVKELYNSGAKRLAIVGLPPLGCEPNEVAANLNFTTLKHECRKEHNSDAEEYNRKLQGRIKTMMEEMPKMKIGYMDVYNPIMEIINRPDAFGFKATTEGCCGTGSGEVGPLCTVFASLCQQRSDYLFFDAAYPTQTAYQYLTNIFKQKILPPLLNY